MYRGQETHPIRMNTRYEMNWTNSFLKNSGNPIFTQIFGHQRAENEAMNTKIYRGKKTHPIRVNAGDEMNGANSFFKKLRKPHFRPNIWPPEGRKKRLWTRKCIGVKRLTHKDKCQVWNELSQQFFQKVPETLSTDGQTDRQTDMGVNPVYPIPPLVEGA